jgi:hypothetical protein
LGGASASPLDDTWTWDGADWTNVPPGAQIDLTPRFGPPGVLVQVDGSGFIPSEVVVIGFRDSALGSMRLASVMADGKGEFTEGVTIPVTATAGKQRIVARGTESGREAEQRFRVT